MIATLDWRRRLAAACLLGLAAWSAGRFHWRSLSWRLAGAAHLSSEAPEALRSKGTGFSFEPEYAAFLDAVRQATPPDATISLVAPRTHENFVYQAAFTLAPRRIVGPGEAAVVQFVAFYADDRALTLPKSARIAHGVLIRR